MWKSYVLPLVLAVMFAAVTLWLLNKGLGVLTVYAAAIIGAVVAVALASIMSRALWWTLAVVLVSTYLWLGLLGASAGVVLLVVSVGLGILAALVAGLFSRSSASPRAA